MAGTAEKLTGKQVQFIAALMAEPSTAAAARRAGCGERTAYRWLSQATFKKAYQQARHDAVTQATSLLQQRAARAVLVLDAIANDAAAPAASRVAASRAIIEAALRSTELEDQALRITALEEEIIDLRGREADDLARSVVPRLEAAA